MTNFELAKKLDLKCAVEGLSKEIESVYCGDFLSFAMSKQDEKAVWLTVMNNINVIGVSSLCNTSMIILCDETTPDDHMIAKATLIKMPIYLSSESVYKTATQIYNILKMI